MEANSSDYMAIQELTRGHELMTKLQSLFQQPNWDQSQSQLAEELSKEVLQALDLTLSFLNSSNDDIQSAAATDADSDSSNIPQRMEGLSLGVSLLVASRMKNSPNYGKIGRRSLNSWTVLSCSPFNDGYQWRKYGEKKICNAEHPRSYYRCTHSGCIAKKQVQQKDSSGDPLQYEVIYDNQHTCNSRRTPTPHLTLPSPDQREVQIISFESNYESKNASRTVGSWKEVEEHQPNCIDSSGQVSITMRSTDAGSSSMNPLFPTDKTKNCDLDKCSSPEGPWFGDDALDYHGML